MPKPIIAENDKGERLQLVGKQWVPMAPDALPGGPPSMTGPDKTALNKLNVESAAADEVSRLYGRAGTALKDLGTGPWRGALLDAAIPEDNGGLMDRVGGAVIGGPLRLSGYLNNKDITNYQTIRSIQSDAVQRKQTQQAGVQTEGDAARIMLSDISPSKTPEANEEIMRTGQEKIDRQKGRADFYSRWAAGYGLNGVDPQGRGVEQAYQDALGAGGFQQTDPTGATAPKRMKFNPATGEIE